MGFAQAYNAQAAVDAEAQMLHREGVPAGALPRRFLDRRRKRPHYA